MRGEELCGVVVYTYPAAATSGRRNVLGKMAFSELNRSLCNIMRVIVHPKYRTVGLGQKLIRETYFRCGTPYVETTAFMAKYNPFFEKAGLIKVQENNTLKTSLGNQGRVGENALQHNIAGQLRVCPKEASEFNRLRTQNAPPSSHRERPPKILKRILLPPTIWQATAVRRSCGSCRSRKTGQTPQSHRNALTNESLSVLEE